MSMRYGKITGLDKPVSRIILGGSSGCLWKGENCDYLLDAAFNLGVNTFDTARGYGKSEETLGNWLERRGLRDKVVIQTKGALHGLLGNNRVNEKCIRADFEKSLKVLKLSCVDVYLLHRDNPKTDVGWIVELLNEFYAAGKIKAFGGSNWHHTRIEQANEYAYKHNLQPFTVSQPHYSLAEVKRWVWIGCLSVAGQNNKDAQDWYARTGFPLAAFSPLSGGFFSGRVKADDVKNTKRNLSFAMRSMFLNSENIERLKRTERISQETGYTVAQIALAWLLNGEMNVFPIVGCSRVESLQKNIAAFDITLSKVQRAYMNLERDDY